MNTDNSRSDDTEGKYSGLRLRLSLAITTLLICLFSLSLPQAGHSAGLVENTIFLPLKINSAGDAGALATSTDQGMQAALDPFAIEMVSRKLATDLFDYGAWPPPFATIKDACESTVDYVIMGSLTETGGRLSVDVFAYDLFDETSIQLFYQEGLLPEFPALMKTLVKEIIAYTNHQAIIAKVLVAGNMKIDSGAIIQKINIENGSPYDKEALRKALKSVYKMGYFDDVTIKVADSPRGKEVTFAVNEKDIISQVIIEGEDELKAETIMDVVDVSPNSIISNQNVNDSVAAIKELYKQEGYYNTEVTSKVTPVANDRVNVTFTIKEGAKVYIKEITISGNKTFPYKTLSKVIQTSGKGWLSWFTDSGVLNQDIIEQDAARLSSFYQDNGFIDVKVSKPETTQKGDWFYIHFNVEEGDRYKVGSVDVSGDLLGDKASVLGRIAINKEQYFSRKTLREDVLAITGYYAENGYAFAEAMPKTDKDVANKRVNIIIDISKKDLIHINRIIVRGNVRTRDKIIRREMRVKENGIFNATALKESQKSLQRLEFFEDVKIEPEPTLESDKMNVVVNVKEKATGNFSIGAGYSSVDSFMFMSEISQNNFLGKGQKVSLQANISGTSNQYNLSFTEPRLADSKLMAGIDLYDWTREYDEYDKDSQGIGLRFGYPLPWWNWKMYGGYSFDDSTLSNLIDNPSQIILDSLDINITSAVKLGFSRDTRDKLSDPSSGNIYSVSVKYAGGFLGGDAQFTKYEATTSNYYPLPLDLVFHYKLSAGWAVANVTDKLPVFEKYYLGGINTIRGFKTANISPIDPSTGEKIGGDKMWYYNFEILFPLIKDVGLKGLVFFDAGNVYDENESWDFLTMKRSVGTGVRWMSPMGPLRLEWGYNIDPLSTESQSNWEFSMGSSF